MEDPNSTLLPYILEALSHKPELSDTFENLCMDIEDQLLQERNYKYTNVRRSIQRALNVGQSLGIISLTNETIRVPFNLRSTARTAKGAAASDYDIPAYELAAIETTQQPVIGTGNPVPIQDKNAAQKRIGHHSSHHSHHHEHHKQGSSSGNPSHAVPAGGGTKVEKSSPWVQRTKNNKILSHTRHDSDDDSEYTIVHPKRQLRRRTKPPLRSIPSSRRTSYRKPAPRRRKNRRRSRGGGYGRRTKYRRY